MKGCPKLPCCPPCLLPAETRLACGPGGAREVKPKSHSEPNVEPQASLVTEETQADRFPSPETNTAARPL